MQEMALRCALKLGKFDEAADLADHLVSPIRHGHVNGYQRRHQPNPCVHIGLTGYRGRILESQSLHDGWKAQWYENELLNFVVTIKGSVTNYSASFHVQMLQ
jgi:hypothetical protein